MNVLALVSDPSFSFFSFLEALATLPAILFILRLILLAAEIFLPGVGIAGGSGIALIILGIILTARTPGEAMVMVALLFIVVGVVLAIVLRSAKKGKLSKTLILKSATRGEDGFRSTNDRSDLVGRTGKPLTVLRPAGSADFNGERLDVVADGSFIPAGQTVQVIRVEGRRIVVSPDQKTS
jgi:membrane-bound ClpP family serine protease